MDDLQKCNSIDLIKQEHKKEIDRLEWKHKQVVDDMAELHQQEKSLLIDRIESKQTFTFGERNKRNNDSDVLSSCSGKDEIDKMHFLVEEKDYMISELQEQIVLLREEMMRSQNDVSLEESYHEECQREIGQLVKENKRLQNDLNNTEENYNEQCLLYKQKLNDERQRNVEIREEMTDMRISYDK